MSKAGPKARPAPSSRTASVGAPGDSALDPGLLDDTHTAYRQWLGDDYDTGALDAVLACAASRWLRGDPPWLQALGGSGAAKTETVAPLAAAGAITVSTISSEAALLSGTPAAARGKKATGGLLRAIGDNGLLVVKDFTSILSMNRDTRVQLLAALREIHDGHWSRNVGTDGGRTLSWHGRVVLIAACTTAWDSAYQVIATMGDRFVLVRLRTGDHRREAGLQAVANVSHETDMRAHLAGAVSKLLEEAAAALAAGPEPALTGAELGALVGLADVVTRARSTVERDYQGNPVFAHDPEVPTRFAKQLVQIARGGLLLGMDRPAALAVAARCCHDTMPPLRRKVAADVAANPDAFVPNVADRTRIPRRTVARTLQELHMLGLLDATEVTYGTERGRWCYQVAEGIDRDELAMCARDVTTR